MATGEQPGEQPAALLQREATTPFDLAAAPPLRVTIAPFSPERTALLISLHHIAGDGWSLNVLARELDAEIISVDSAQVYRDMDVGTAKPSRDELAAAPHHLIDILDVTETDRKSVV